MPRHMPSRNRKRTNLLTIMGVVILILLIVALINSYFVHQRMLERKQKVAADAVATQTALQRNIQSAKQSADLAAKKAAAAQKAAQAINAANAVTQSFQNSVEETQNYTAKLNEIMTRWFSEYSNTQNDTMTNRAGHVANLVAIYNELASYKVAKSLQDTKAQLLGEMATILDRLNVDPATHRSFVRFEHDDADVTSTPVPTVVSNAATAKTQDPFANLPGNTAEQVEAARQLGASFLNQEF